MLKYIVIKILIELSLPKSTQIFLLDFCVILIFHLC